MYEITSGVVSSAQKVVIYGPEGIGKSTLRLSSPTLYLLILRAAQRN